MYFIIVVSDVNYVYIHLFLSHNGMASVKCCDYLFIAWYITTVGLRTRSYNIHRHPPSFEWYVGVEREWRYSSTHSIPPHSMGVGGQCQAPAALPTRKNRSTLCTGGWADPGIGLAGCVEDKISCNQPSSNPRTYQPVISRYADYAIPSPYTHLLVGIMVSN